MSQKNRTLDRKLSNTGSPRRSRVCHSRFRLFPENILSLVLLFATGSLDYSRFFTLFSSFMGYHKSITLYVYIYYTGNIISCFYCSILILDSIVSILIIFYLIITSCLRGRFATRRSLSFIYHFIYKTKHSKPQDSNPCKLFTRAIIISTESYQPNAYDKFDFANFMTKCAE